MDAAARAAGDALADAARAAAKAAGPSAASGLPGLDGGGGQALSALGPLLARHGPRIPPGLPPAVRAWAGGAAPQPRTTDQDHRVARALTCGQPELAFARTYENLISAALRRALGTFFTPPPVVEFMSAALGDVCAPRTVVDAGAGVGALTVAAQRRWPGADVHGIDVNAAALGLLAFASDARRARAEAGHPAGRLVLACEDYLSWVVREWEALPQPRALLANPPFTRHQARTSAEKDLAAAAAGDTIPHRTASLSTYVLASTLNRLAAGDAICVLLPDNWLQAAYALPLRRRLWALQRRVDVYAFPQGHDVFPDARVRAVVLLVGPEAPGAALKLHAVRPGSARVTTTQRTVRTVRPEPDEGQDPLGDLWNTWLRGESPPAAPAARARARTGGKKAKDEIRLADLVLVRRGIATGSNATFLLNDEQARGIPPGFLRPAVHKLSHVEGDVLDGDAHDKIRIAGRRCWLLDAPHPADVPPAVGAVLKAAAGAGVPGRVLCSRRPSWTELPFGDPPAVLFAPAAHNGFRVVLNEHGAYATNNLFGLSARQDLPPLPSRAWVALADWLRSDDAQAQWRRLAKIHSGGLLKLEPRAARSVVLPPQLAETLRAMQSDAPAADEPTTSPA
jgi:adenine-specific DNA-methyltransferase